MRLRLGCLWLLVYSSSSPSGPLKALENTTNCNAYTTHREREGEREALYVVLKCKNEHKRKEKVANSKTNLIVYRANLMVFPVYNK